MPMAQGWFLGAGKLALPVPSSSLCSGVPLQIKLCFWLFSLFFSKRSATSQCSSGLKFTLESDM